MTELSSATRAALRRLPSVERLAEAIGEGVNRPTAIAAARLAIAERRRDILAAVPVELTDEALRAAAVAQAARLTESSLRDVINATGVILHTNLGRAPLAPEAAEAAARAASSYTNLEYDLKRGARGSRQAHVEPLLREISGAEAAMAVNNNAAAVLVALAALAGRGEVVVSRGQLVEIGGSFRVPDILAAAGVRLVEVGTTNRTRLADYEGAIGAQTAALLRVHQSNFRTIGFVEEVGLAALCRLGEERGLPVIDDLGSGAVEPIGDEPTLSASVASGASVVCCSADKLLGGPQAGLLAGSATAIERCRAHPLARAVRIDKMQLAALEATLRLHRDHEGQSTPVSLMLGADPAELEARAATLAGEIGERARVARGASRPGGGSLPRVELKGPVCVIDPGPEGAERLSSRLRGGQPPILARIKEGCLLLDPRTMSSVEAGVAADAVRAALR